MNRSIRLLGISTVLFGTASGGVSAETVTWVHTEPDPRTVETFEKIVSGYEAAHPDVEIELQYLENEAFKSRLPTMLQSGDAPDIFLSWGGGVLAEQVRGGVLRDISDAMDDEWRSWIAPSALGAFTIEDKVYGVPIRTTLVGFFYNKRLFQEADLNAETIRTWSDLLAAVDTLKAAGTTPMTIGGSEGWPQHFYFSELAIRLAGNEKLAAALDGQGEGFNDPAFVDAFAKLRELADKEPFQEGWLGAQTGQSYANFGNGDAAMLLQGDWALGQQAAQSVSGDGLGDDLGWMAFPQVEGGVPDSEETFGGVNGWIFYEGASDAAVDFVRFYSQPDNAKLLATETEYLPPAPGIAEVLEDPWKRELAERIEASSYHQNFYNVMFSEDVNRELLDIVTGAMTGDYSAGEAAQALQDAWEFSQ